MLTFTGADNAYKDSSGFSLTKWKQRVDRFRGLNLTPYVADGTIVGHFLMDEPSDPSNWYGNRVSLPDIDEMARYSKEIWPTMPTIIRGWPDYLKGYQYKYLYAAWAQYHQRFGSIDTFISDNVREAQADGLALVAGMNVLNGGTAAGGIPGRTRGKYGMSASEIKTWGTAPYPSPISVPWLCGSGMPSTSRVPISRRRSKI